jgi:Fur family ferric uptake transcriptional regulator
MTWVSNVKARLDLTTMQADLRRRGYRVTPQREAILRVFEGLPEGTHLSAEALHERLRENEQGIGLATTYRTLRLLVSMGFLRELNLSDGQRHYEMNEAQGSPHHHLICVACNRAVEFDRADLHELGRAIAADNGFALLDVQYKIYGTCAACQGRPHAQTQRSGDAI